MWKWLRKRPLATDDQAITLANPALEAYSLAVAVAETVRDYVGAVKAGKISYPAHRREVASVVEIWSDLRVEALHKLFNFGRSDPLMLGDIKWQSDLLTAFLDDRVHLRLPQPQGAIVPDTIQAVWQVYLYLDAAGSEVADRETDREGLRLEERSILDRLEASCLDARRQWASVGAGEPNDAFPLTMFELLYEDVTAKSKSIALSKVFGPHYESGIKHVEQRLARQGDGLREFQAMVKRVLGADDPDRLSST